MDSKIEEIRHFFEMEIWQTNEWLNDESITVFNGVKVGRENAVKLMRNHIWYCRHILEMIDR